MARPKKVKVDETAIAESAPAPEEKPTVTAPEEKCCNAPVIPTKNRYQFYSIYNNLNISGLTLFNTKVIIFETVATSLEKAVAELENVFGQVLPIHTPQDLLDYKKRIFGASIQVDIFPVDFVEKQNIKL